VRRLHHSLAGSSWSCGRIRFVILRTGLSPRAAPHRASQPCSCLWLPGNQLLLPGEDFHLQRCAFADALGFARQRQKTAGKAAPASSGLTSLSLFSISGSGVGQRILKRYRCPREQESSGAVWPIGKMQRLTCGNRKMMYSADPSCRTGHPPHCPLLSSALLLCRPKSSTRPPRPSARIAGRPYSPQDLRALCAINVGKSLGKHRSQNGYKPLPAQWHW
jgi:hypothetical protein